MCVATSLSLWAEPRPSMKGPGVQVLTHARKSLDPREPPDAALRGGGARQRAAEGVGGLRPALRRLNQQRQPRKTV